MFHSESIIRFRENKEENSDKTCAKKQCIGALTQIIVNKNKKKQKTKTRCRWQETYEKNELSDSKIEDVSITKSKIEAREIMDQRLRQFCSFSYRPHTHTHTHTHKWFIANQKRQKKIRTGSYFERENACNIGPNMTNLYIFIYINTYPNKINNFTLFTCVLGIICADFDWRTYCAQVSPSCDKGFFFF